MKTKTVRVRKTGSTPAAKVQPQTPAYTPQSRYENGPFQYAKSLVLFDCGEGIARVDLTPAQFQFIQDAARNRLATLDDILASGLARMTRKIPDSDLEMAKTEACALLELLCDKLDHITRDGSDFTGPAAESMVAGISLMVLGVQERLQSSFKGVFDALHAPLQTASGEAEGGAR